MDEWPSALAVATALQDLLVARLDDFDQKQITLSRDEAVLCLGVISGVVEQLENEQRKSGHAV